MFLVSLGLNICAFSVFFSAQVSAWQVDPDCSLISAASFLTGLLDAPLLGGDLSGHVRQATLEAQSIALYMAKKALIGPRVGNLMQDLLSAPNEDDPETLAWIAASVTNIIAALNIPSTNEGGGTGLIIKCTDTHLTPVSGANGVFRDIQRGNTRVQVPLISLGVSGTACGLRLQAFAYPYPGGQVIVLCSDSEWGATKVYNEVTLDKWRIGGDLRKNPLVRDYGVDGLAGSLSVKILHELFHVGGMLAQQRSGFGTLNPFPATLPDTDSNGLSISEVYTWRLISGKRVGSPTLVNPDSPALSHNNALHNADSMALLGAGWYLPYYGWLNGECKTVGAARQSPLQYEGQGLPMYPDGYGGFENID